MYFYGILPLLLIQEELAVKCALNAGNLLLEGLPRNSLARLTDRLGDFNFDS